MNDLELKRDYLLKLNYLREKIPTYKFVHVFANDKFCKSIVEFISDNFNKQEHCFVFIGGVPEDEIPLPVGQNVYSFPSCVCLANSDHIDKFIFHGMYVSNIANYLYVNKDILAKSYWMTWGRDIYESFDDDENAKYVKSHMQGVAANPRARKVYLSKYEHGTHFFDYDICYESIPYNIIAATRAPQKDFIQILVNNVAHETTLEVLDNIKRYRKENIKVATVLSYGDLQWKNLIMNKGRKIFGDNFIPVEKFLQPEEYIKFLARNDIYIINHRRPQGMTTLYTMMLLGKKVFMRYELSDYLKMGGYAISDTQAIAEMSFNDFIQAQGVENNRELARRRFDKEHTREFWQTVFNHVPDKNSLND